MTNRISSSGYRHSLPRRFSRRFLSQQTTKKKWTDTCMYARLYVCEKCCCMFSSLSLSLSVCKTSTHPPTTAKIYCRERMIITRARIRLFDQSFTLLSHLLAARVTTTKPPLMAQMTSTHMAAGVRWLYVCLRTNTHTVVWRHPHTRVTYVH